MWKNRLTWKYVTIQFEVNMPENIEEEFNTQMVLYVSLLWPTVKQAPPGHGSD